MIYQAEDYLNQKVKQKVKRVEADLSHPVKWDLDSGDYKEMVKEEKKK